jgi:hypothetical protein
MQDDDEDDGDDGEKGNKQNKEKQKKKFTVTDYEREQLLKGHVGASSEDEDDDKVL